MRLVSRLLALLLVVSLSGALPALAQVVGGAAPCQENASEPCDDCDDRGSEPCDDCPPACGLCVRCPIQALPGPALMAALDPLESSSVRPLVIEGERLAGIHESIFHPPKR